MAERLVSAGMESVESVFEGQRLLERNPNGQHTIVLVGGFSVGVDMQEGLSEALAQEGFRVISFDSTTQTQEEAAPDGDYHPRYHTAKTAQTAAIVDRYARENDAGEKEKVTLVGHSRGFVQAVGAARQHPELVDGVIGLNPVGLFGDDTFPRLAARFSIETVRPEGTMWKMPRELGRMSRKRIFGNLRDSAGDVVDIARSDVRTDAATLQEWDIKVDVVIGANDRGFPWRLYKKGLGISDETTPGQLAIDGISSYYPTERAHNEPFAGERAGHQQPLIFTAETARLIHQTVFPDKNIEDINQNLVHQNKPLDS